MRRRTFLGAMAASLVVGRAAWAQDPAAAPPDGVAPAAPAGATGLLIANKAAGFVTPLEKKAVQALFRGLLAVSPGGQRVLVYLLPAGSAAQLAVLDGTMGWSEVAFERQAALVESSVGRPYFKRLKGSSEVLAAVAGDPGGVGIVSPDTLLSPAVVVLWPGGG